jgi:hypothetical protein
MANQPRIRPKVESKGVASPAHLSLARNYLKRGWRVIPVPYREKAPKGNAWHKQEITLENVAQHFDSQRSQNIGLLLGRASGGVTDVDLDCQEALARVKLLPPTATFGRPSKPRSHWLYLTGLCETEKRAVIKYVEPPGLARDPKAPAVLVELRTGGGDKAAQTIMPGSIHPSGEQVRWDDEVEPARVNGADLKNRVAALAAGALLVRHYPAEGKRHDAALVLGGLLARKPGLVAADIERFVSAIAIAAGDAEAEERGRSAAGAVELLNKGEPCPGLPRMQEVWGEELAKAVAKWLGVERERDGDGQPKADRAAKAKQADSLIAIARAEAVVFHSRDGDGYADITVNDHTETWAVHSKGFKRWLVGRYYQETDNAPNSEALRNALNVIEAQARYDGPMRDVYTRVASIGDKVYLDLADTDWTVIEIDANGWRPVEQTPVRFRRRAGQLPYRCLRRAGRWRT